MNANTETAANIIQAALIVYGAAIDAADDATDAAIAAGVESAVWNKSNATAYRAAAIPLMAAKVCAAHVRVNTARNARGEAPLTDYRQAFAAAGRNGDQFREEILALLPSI